MNESVRKVIRIGIFLSLLIIPFGFFLKDTVIRNQWATRYKEMVKQWVK